MKKFVKCLIMVVLIAAMVVPLVGCGGDRALVGRWENQYGGGIELFSDGALFARNLDGYGGYYLGEGTWYTYSNRITLNHNMSFFRGTFDFNVSGSTLRLERDDGFIFEFQRTS